jgi:hypothetical protein
MRVFLLVITAPIVLLAANCALAQDPGGVLASYGDPSFLDCNLVETVGSVNTVYIVHCCRAEAAGCRFRVVHNWHQATVLATDYHSNSATGDVYTGVTVDYPGCQPLPHLVATLRFMTTSPTPECEVLLFVIPDPSAESGEIEATDCSGTTLIQAGGGTTVNGHPANCPCMWLDEFPYPDWVGAEQTTWGRVKSLYR